MLNYSVAELRLFKGIFEAVHTRLLFQNPEKELFGTSGGAA